MLSMRVYSGGNFNCGCFENEGLVNHCILCFVIHRTSCNACDNFGNDVSSVSKLCYDCQEKRNKICVRCATYYDDNVEIMCGNYVCKRCLIKEKGCDTCGNMEDVVKRSPFENSRQIVKYCAECLREQLCPVCNIEIRENNHEVCIAELGRF